ncbi:MAG: 16S rRNA (adenine(1518)-N(6)/adenine(1519)-N(6))-dimethyltransferase RsmA [Burkholderiales bacterium]
MGEAAPALRRHIPRKRFSQHFLIDRGVIDAIVGAIDPAPNDLIVEVGPGLGALTRPLLDRLKHLHAVEIDRDIVARLARQYSGERLTLHQADALRFDFDTLGEKVQVVGNLPYNISTPLLFHFATFRRISKLWLMLQLEVVHRMAATPSTPAYGRLSVALQHRYRIDVMFSVPAQAFKPVPKVESAVVCMTPRPTGESPQTDQMLETILIEAFSKRRKTLRNALKHRLTEQDFRALLLDPALRPENLGVNDYLGIARHLARC